HGEGQLRLVEPAPGELELPLRRPLQCGEQPQQRALAGPGRSHEAQQLSKLHVEAIDREHGMAGVAVGQRPHVIARGSAHVWYLPWRLRITAFTARARASSQPPSARATANSPLPVSSTMAVVSTRVCPWTLPPTMSDAPTSEMQRPNPAATATRTPGAASRSTARRACHGPAPSERTW